MSPACGRVALSPAYKPTSPLEPDTPPTVSGPQNKSPRRPSPYSPSNRVISPKAVHPGSLSERPLRAFGDKQRPVDNHLQSAGDRRLSAAVYKYLSAGSQRIADNVKGSVEHHRFISDIEQPAGSRPRSRQELRGIASLSGRKSSLSCGNSSRGLPRPPSRPYQENRRRNTVRFSSPQSSPLRIKITNKPSDVVDGGRSSFVGGGNRHSRPYRVRSQEHDVEPPARHEQDFAAAAGSAHRQPGSKPSPSSNNKDFICALCGKIFGDITATAALNHVREVHDVHSLSAASRQLILPHRLIVTRCQHCAYIIIAEPAGLKRELRPHRDHHSRLSTSLNDCFRDQLYTLHTCEVYIHSFYKRYLPPTGTLSYRARYRTHSFDMTLHR